MKNVYIFFFNVYYVYISLTYDYEAAVEHFNKRYDNTGYHDHVIFVSVRNCQYC